MSTYWDERARRQFNYRGEAFYTVTPIPFYYERRKWLLEKLKSVMSDAAPKNAAILDFGCGDGYYSRIIQDWFPEYTVLGYDLSPEMVSVASSATSSRELSFTSSKERAAEQSPFDLVMCIAVLAHIPDQELAAEAKFLASVTRPGSTLIFFEQTSDRPRSGPAWSRRTIAYYKSLFEGAGFRNERIQTYSRPVFQALSSVPTLAFKGWRRIGALAGSGPSHGNPNLSSVIRAGYDFCERVSRGLDKTFPSSEGNTIFVFRRTAELDASIANPTENP